MRYEILLSCQFRIHGRLVEIISAMVWLCLSRLRQHRYYLLKFSFYQCDLVFHQVVLRCNALDNIVRFFTLLYYFKSIPAFHCLGRVLYSAHPMASVRDSDYGFSWLYSIPFTELSNHPIYILDIFFWWMNRPSHALSAQPACPTFLYHKKCDKIVFSKVKNTLQNRIVD